MLRPRDLAENLARDPKRWAEARRFYEAIHAALSKTHVGGEQDALAMWEAFSLMLAQLTAGVDDEVVDGILVYIDQRVRHHRPDFRQSGKAARHYIAGTQ